MIRLAYRLAALRTGSLFIAPSRMSYGKKLLCRRLLLVLLKPCAQCPPAGILCGLRRVGIFFALQPEAKPIDVSLLRGETLPGLFQKMGAIRNVDQHHRFPESRQTGKPFPLSQ